VRDVLCVVVLVVMLVLCSVLVVPYVALRAMRAAWRVVRCVAIRAKACVVWCLVQVWRFLFEEESSR
jgi:hypothetical protein